MTKRSCYICLQPFSPPIRVDAQNCVDPVVRDEDRICVRCRLAAHNDGEPAQDAR